MNFHFSSIFQLDWTGLDSFLYDEINLYSLIIAVKPRTTTKKNKSNLDDDDDKYLDNKTKKLVQINSYTK